MSDLGNTWKQRVWQSNNGFNPRGFAVEFCVAAKPVGPVMVWGSLELPQSQTPLRPDFTRPKVEQHLTHSLGVGHD